MDIYIPYTYLIGWTNQNKFYYGRRTAKNCHPLEFWTKYFTSSREVKKFREEHGEPDIIQIRKTFPNNPDGCKLWEAKFLERVNAQHNPKFLNKKNGDHKWDTTGTIPWNKGIPRSESTKEKISNSNRGRHLGPQSKETCLKKSIANKGQIPWNKGHTDVYREESRKLISQSKLGKPRPDSVKKALSESKKNKVCCIDILEKRKKLIEKEEFEKLKGIRYFGLSSKKGNQLLNL